MAGFLALALAVLVAGERVRGAIRAQTKAQREHALAELALRRREIAAQITVSEDEIIPRLNQIVLDVTGRPGGIYKVRDVRPDPVPHVLAVDSNGLTRFFFMAGGTGDMRVDGARYYSVDALSCGDLFTVRVLEQIYLLLASQFGLRPEALVLPRRESWTLAIQNLSQLPLTGRKSRLPGLLTRLWRTDRQTTS